ncbi:biotin--[acetyl-CoA-carboxylase] ligase [Gluconacetobacter diazotrophicus]|uniref:biotin--[biotin carboxyl-carrier protein] ligase n=1 Tax=Gluconacetobacter diazotrophicus (strain ATCC 49037 / DSM 5601 / CCUG 37298 / CIP 103539 / LMG 7603 / PAl5) TaxID=272568 RepID=A9HRS1_GLUDA|nr:biotin--[acetyl-CoA-carboxylase] ligase [Gluconacetobacter diazotrophicus]CAP56970.1 putative biotin--[acetyl-CoA-carboxylase] synthetase [Gluconacetobacter diazotrophicus PA1 5]
MNGATPVAPVPPPGPTPWRLEIHDELDSTSDTCLARAGQGERSGLAVMARRQTRGRGSRGRDWQDPGGNLAFSVLLRPGGKGEWPVGLWPFIAGLAFHGAIAPWIPHPISLRLKWPNDLLLEGRKAAGILIEAGTDSSGRLLVIGFGANLRAAPAITGRDLACVAEYGTAPEPEIVARAICAGLDHWMAVCGGQGDGLGFEAVRQAWLAHAHPMGTRLVVRAESGQVEGSFAGLDAQGMLLLRCADGLKRISTGEILLLD